MVLCTRFLVHKETGQLSFLYLPTVAKEGFQLGCFGPVRNGQKQFVGGKRGSRKCRN